MTHMLNNALRPNAGDLRVVGMVEPDQVRAEEALTDEEKRGVGFFRTVDELVEKARPDALAIGTRCHLHAAYACEAAAYDLPVFLEKPVAVSMEQALALETAYAASSAKVVVSFPLRASGLLSDVMDLVRSPEMGGAEHLLGVNYVPYGNVYFDSWYRDFSITQGLFLQKATHDFDYLALLAGAPIVRVAATISQGRVFRDVMDQTGCDDAAYFEDIGSPESGMNEDSSNALLEFANGVKGLYTQVFYAKGEAQARGATISSYKGTVNFDWYKNQIRHVCHASGKSREWQGRDAGGHFGGDAVLGQNFSDVVQNGAESVSPLSAGLSSVFSCLAAKESARTGCFVDVHQCRTLEAAVREAALCG